MNNFFEEILIGKYPFIVAEIGANHNGNVELAKRLIDEAVNCGFSSVKFQSWSAESLYTKKFYKENKDQLEVIKKYSLSKEDHLILNDYCKRKNIIFFSTPFSPDEVDMLYAMDVPFFKVASMDLNNLPFLKYIATKGKPIILSTGMGSLGEIEEAINTIYETGNKEIILLHCISIYPPDDSIINLRNILMLRETFGLPVGFSDHTLGVSIPLAAIALGAKLIEKHFTLDKTLPGWDHVVSANPEEMRIIVQEGKRIIDALGKYKRSLSNVEIEKRKAFRRSVITSRPLKKGEIIREEDLIFKRPGTGIKPNEIKYILGRKVKRDISEDEIIVWEDLE
jgi:N-acetylneuraminate synthase